MSIVIYHNPACGTSRNTLAMIRQSGEEPEIIEYLKTPPSRERLKGLIAAIGIPVRALLREKGTPYHDPWAWIINNSLALAGPAAPLLCKRAEGELLQIEAVASRHARRWAAVPLQAEEPIGIEQLQRLARR